MSVSLPVTSVVALLSTLLIIYLALKVVSYRQKYRIGYGDAGNKELCKAISSHSNAIENIPLALLLLLMLELNNVNQILLITLGGLLVMARIMQASGLLKSMGVSFGRSYGTLLSWMLMVVMAVVNVLMVFN